jgi:hypothetical protein
MYLKKGKKQINYFYRLSRQYSTIPAGCERNKKGGTASAVPPLHDTFN